MATTPILNPDRPTALSLGSSACPRPSSGSKDKPTEVQTANAEAATFAESFMSLSPTAYMKDVGKQITGQSGFPSLS